MKPKAVVLLSGGLDSATSAAQAIADGYELIALSCRYGQRHERELIAAKQLVEYLGIEKHFVIDIPLALFGGGSALLTKFYGWQSHAVNFALTEESLDVPTDGVKSNEIPVTYVPGRNTVFIAIALSLAEAKEAEAIYLGINAVDYSGYPDCRPEYLEAYQNLATLSSKVGLEGKAPRLVAPLVMDSKVDIVYRALRLEVPIELTWSCYQGQEEPCGLCDSCRIRDQALIDAGRPDLSSLVGRALYEQETPCVAPVS